MSNENQQNQSGKDAKKIIAVYDSSTKKLLGLLKGDWNAGKKLQEDELAEFIEDLFKEEKEALKKELKDAIRELLKKKVALENGYKEILQKAEKELLEKKKDFNQAAKKIFDKMKGLEAITAQYETAATEMTTAAEAPDETNEEETKE